MNILNLHNTKKYRNYYKIIQAMKRLPRKLSLFRHLNQKKKKILAQFQPFNRTPLLPSRVYRWKKWCKNFTSNLIACLVRFNTIYHDVWEWWEIDLNIPIHLHSMQYYKLQRNSVQRNILDVTSTCLFEHAQTCWS